MEDLSTSNVQNPWEYYLSRSRDMVSRFSHPKVLKADASNEALGVPAPGGIAGNLDAAVVCLEVDPAVLQQAIPNCPGSEFIHGDIRSIPLDSRSFDLVLDLSTIDHVHPDDLDTVLSEYHRVLRPFGWAYIISWCSGNPKYQEDQKGWLKTNPNLQFYHDETRLAQTIVKYFHLSSSRNFYQYSDIHLREFVCEKYE